MKIGFVRRGLIFVLVLAVVILPGPGADAQSFSGTVSARSAVLMTADTGRVLFEKDGDARLSMASTTKIMTALLTLEEAQRQGDPAVTVTEEMVHVEGSSMGLQPGDVLPLSGLAKGMLLASGNDAANAAAIFIGGSAEGFAEKMNARAAAIGMENTHFVTPSGLDDEAHYSTARDMGLLAIEALKNKAFREIAASASLQVEFLEPKKLVTYTNHNKLLQLYDGCIGVKTGFTKKSGRCLVSAAERNGVTLVCVTLNAPDDWNDHSALLDYGFAAVQSVSFDGSGFSAWLPVVGGQSQEVQVRGMRGASVTLEKEEADSITSAAFLPRFVYAPVEKGDEIGRLRYYAGDTPVFSVPILARESIPAVQPEPSFWEKLFGG